MHLSGVVPGLRAAADGWRPVRAYDQTGRGVREQPGEPPAVVPQAQSPLVGQLRKWPSFGMFHNTERADEGGEKKKKEIENSINNVYLCEGSAVWIIHSRLNVRTPELPVGHSTRLLTKIFVCVGFIYFYSLRLATGGRNTCISADAAQSWSTVTITAWYVLSIHPFPDLFCSLMVWQG